MTNTPGPAATRVAHIAALIQAVLLTGVTALWATSLVVSEHYEQSFAARADPQYSKGFALAVWGTLIILTVVALMLVVAPAWGLRRGKRSARGWLVAGEIVTLAPVAVLTVATVDQHYFGPATWLLITHDVAAATVLAALLWPKRGATRSHRAPASQLGHVPQRAADQAAHQNIISCSWPLADIRNSAVGRSARPDA